jgi:hypothetical protein
VNGDFEWQLQQVAFFFVHIQLEPPGHHEHYERSQDSCDGVEVRKLLAAVENEIRTVEEGPKSEHTKHEKL